MTRPGGARDQVARLLALVPFLHQRGSVTVDQAATALGVPASQLVRDLAVLLMCGLPGGYPDDLIDVDLDALEGEAADGVIRVSNADYLARPLRLTATEATALVVALRAVRSEADPRTAEVVDRTLRKLEAAAGQGSGTPRVEPGRDPEDHSLDALREVIGQAVAERRQLRLRYWVPSRDEVSDRVVDPRGVVLAQRTPYLDAWCHSAEAPRLFRLDRIHEAELLPSRIRTRKARPRDLSEGFFTSPAEATKVTLRLDPAARWVPEYYPVAAVRHRRGGVLEVDLHVADERWLRRLLLRLAPHARVVRPSAVAVAFESDARAALGLYR